MKNLAEDWIPTRQSLLSRLRDWDDRASWQDFFETYWKLIFNVARRSGLSSCEAQEVVQETIITVAKQLPQFRYDRGKGSFKGWLLRTTQWRIGDQFRKRRINEPLDPTDSDDAPRPEAAVVDGPDWDKMWHENLLEAALQRVKQRADPREFQMFDLTVHHAWDSRKVAEKLRVTRAHVYYARQKVARMIRKEFAALEKKGA